jgi:predicted transposase YbfD/YdcC
MTYFEDFLDAFNNLPDFRQEGKVKHQLFEIIFIAVSASIANANSWIEIADFADCRADWLKKYLKLENGIPSHDTLQRVFEHLDPKAFNRAFMHWTSKIADHSDGRIIAIDGKTVRGSYQDDKRPIHIVNAWVDENNMILGQVKTSDKSNEITAIPEMLELLFLKGSIVTIDAMGTQKEIAKKIVSKGGDYVLALKGNQTIFHSEVCEYFGDALKDNFSHHPVSRYTTIEKGHGRIEKREYFQTGDINWFAEKKLWKNLSSIGMVKRTITTKGKTTEETCYFISSLEAPQGECQVFGKAVRNHWGVESCHWMLDVLFKEDQSRVRVNNGAENQSMLKKMALNIVRNQDHDHSRIRDKKVSGNRKRLMSSWSIDFLDKMIEVMKKDLE